LRRWAGLWLGLFLGSAFLLSGCGSSGSDVSAVRFLQASPDAPPVSVLVDGKTVAGGLNYGNASGYSPVQPGSHHIQVVPVNGSTPILDQSFPFPVSENLTMLLSGPAASIRMVTLTDGGTTSVSGSGYVRVVNASSTMGPADVYIVTAGSGIGGVSPVTAGLGFGQDTGYHVIVAGNYQVFMTTPGTPNALLSTGSISLTAAQNQTVVALDGSSGGFQYTLLTDQ
jgi:Domain of unknown function (DUF4397)